MSNTHKGSSLWLEGKMVTADKNTSFLAHYDITTSDVLYGLQPINDTTTIRNIEGRFGGGIAVEEGTTNLIETVGGGASQDWTKWSHYSNTTYWTNPSQYSDSNMGMVFKGTPTGNTVFLYDYYPYTYTSGGTYINSIYLKSNYNLPNQVLSSYLNTGVGGQHNVADSVSFTGISTSWKRYEATHVAYEQVNANGGVGWNLGVIPSGCTIYASMPQLENRISPTSFVKGTRGSGILRYSKEPINPSEGTISLWFYTGSKSPQSYSRLFQIGDWTSDVSRDNLEIRWGSGWNNADNIEFEITQKGVVRQGLNTGVIGITPYTWYYIAVTWKTGGKMSMTLINNTTGVKTYKEGNLTNNPTFASEGFFSVGSGSGLINGIIDELRIDRVQRSAEEVEGWYISRVPFYPKGIHRLAY